LQVRCGSARSTTSVWEIRRARILSRARFAPWIATALSSMDAGRCSMRTARLCLWAEFCAVSSGRLRHGMSLSPSSRNPSPGGARRTSWRTRSGRVIAISVATIAPKEKPMREHGLCTNWSRPAQSGSIVPCTSLPSTAATSDSPKPGISGTRTRCPASESGSTLRSQWFQLPLPPCRSTEGRPWPHSCHTVMRPLNIVSWRRARAITLVTLSVMVAICDSPPNTWRHTRYVWRRKSGICESRFPPSSISSLCFKETPNKPLQKMTMN
jgi:hypothetical protein